MGRLATALLCLFCIVVLAACSDSGQAGGAAGSDTSGLDISAGSDALSATVSDSSPFAGSQASSFLESESSPAQASSTAGSNNNPKEQNRSSGSLTNSKASHPQSSRQPESSAAAPPPSSYRKNCWGTPEMMENDLAAYAASIGMWYDETMTLDNGHWITPKNSWAASSSNAYKIRLQESMDHYLESGYTRCRVIFVEDNSDNTYDAYIVVD